MMRTCVGYTGGTTPDPTYRRMGDHSEALQIEFDPAQITYIELLQVFWASHNPLARSWSPQYQAAVFVHDEVQAAAAQESLDMLKAGGRGEIRTPIRPAGVFVPAEDYHQKYYLQHQRALWSYFNELYPDPQVIFKSTAAARVNGYLRGYNRKDLKNQVDLLPEQLLQALNPG